MSEEQTPRLERLLEQTARRVSGGDLHPLEILQRVEQVFEAAAAGGTAPNDIRVALHPADHERYRPALERLEREIAALLDRVEARRRLRRFGDRIVRIEPSVEAEEGRPKVRALFADTRHQDRAPVPGQTRRLRRHRQVFLVTGDGTRLQVSHTPLTIGRGPDNDLVIASMAVSRRHAELLSTPDGFLLRDLGSSNGLIVGGERVASVVMSPGVSVLLGDTELRLEQAG